MAKELRAYSRALKLNSNQIAQTWVRVTAEDTSRAQDASFRPGLEIAGLALLKALKDTGIEMDLTGAIDSVRAAWGTYLAGAKLCDDTTEELLSTLRSLTKSLGIVTDSDSSMVEPLISRLGLRQAFDIVLVSDEVGAYKPSPRVYLAALQKANAQPESSLFVSNSRVDTLGALATGMGAVWVRRGIIHSNSEGIEGAIVIRDMSALPQVIREAA